MGNNLFGINLGNIIAAELGPLMLDAQLIVPGAPAAIDPANPLADRRTGTDTTIPGKGFIDEYNDFAIDGTNILRGDRKITLIADTFAGSPVPTNSNRISIEGNTYQIIGDVRRDPAAATYTCQARL